ncbi:MAG: hypothetical protein HYV03_07525 [Deltaproteobacteria bacterium]|nr:hypothetical protein [Deltaproteobacteria bacterium]
MINPLRDYMERRRIRTEVNPSAAQPSGQPPVDPLCTYRPLPGEEWTFDGQHIFLNSHDVSDWLKEDQEVGLWCGLIDALETYRDWADSRNAPQRGRLASVVWGLQELTMGNLRRVYEEKIGGMSIRWGDGHCLLNNINVRAMLAMYHWRPTSRARRFLEGLRHKLALILCHPPISPHGARAEEMARGLYDDICASLATPPIDTCSLPPGDRDRTGDCA